MQSVLIVLLLISICISIGMLAFSFTCRDRARAKYLAAITFCILVYTLGYLIEITCTTRNAAMAALQVQNMGIPLVGPLFLLMALSFFKSDSLKRWYLPVSIVYGLAFFIVIFFNESHLLYYANIEMIDVGSYYFTKLTPGPLYFIQQGVTLCTTISAYILLASRFLRGTPKLRSQMYFFIIGSVFGFVANILNVTKILPYGIDPTPFALTVGLLFFSAELFKSNLLDIASTASDLAIETMDDALIVLDGNWGFVYCNERARQLIPALASLSGTELITSADDWPEQLKVGMDAGQVSFERDEGEQSYAYRANVSPVTDATQRTIGWSIVIRDVTDTTRMMEKLESLATTDPLTGINNRRHFINLASREMDMARRHAHTMALILFDIDHFKQVNDRYGHLVGDDVLCAIVNAVAGQLRSYDIFARYGGEEFVILTTVNAQQPILPFAERLCRTIENTEIEYEFSRIPITASFGVVEIPPGADFRLAMSVVDEAMYEAKARGRNQVVMFDMPKEKRAGIFVNK